jgi:molybdenum cofactor cytidylyltransferase
MGAVNKLLAPLDGQPVLTRVVRRLADAAVDPIVVVTGHDEAAVQAACAGLPVGFAHNLDFARGMSTSLRCGVTAIAIDPDVDGALVALGDMPWIEPSHLERLVRAFRSPADIVAPRFGGRRGNPVLFGRDHFPALRRATGDAGARSVLAQQASRVRWVDMPDDAVHRDVDEPEDLR